MSGEIFPRLYCGLNYHMLAGGGGGGGAECIVLSVRPSNPESGQIPILLLVKVCPWRGSSIFTQTWKMFQTEKENLFAERQIISVSSVLMT